VLNFIRGVKTSEFWMVVGTILNLIVTQWNLMIEKAGTTAGDAVVAATPPEVWTSIGGVAAAVLYAFIRGLQKSKLMTPNGGNGQ
jgi:hypothetical protein